MSESFSAFGFFVHTPCGPRKSGIPESVEMPAPVSTTTLRALSTQPRTSATTWGFALMGGPGPGPRRTGTSRQARARAPRCVAFQSSPPGHTSVSRSDSLAYEEVPMKTIRLVSAVLAVLASAPLARAACPALLDSKMEMLMQGEASLCQYS